MINTYKSFLDSLRIKNYEDITTTTGNIAKKLNSTYYNVDNDSNSHMYIVGSVGRKTAVNGNSDLDLLFDLPHDLYLKYDNYESNGQSALLQDIKNTLLKKYPNSNISGDGQVVVIAFDKYTIELVPGFKQNDGSFKYPDTHNNGTWKTTNPLKEQEGCTVCETKSNNIYYDFCRMIRCWKNNKGFKFGGLLIDTLVYNYFVDNNYFKDNSDDYTTILLGLFDFLQSQKKDQSYWHAVGSNQLVYNSNNGKFVSQAKKACNKLSEALDNDNVIDALEDIFGSLYSDSSSNSIFVKKSFLKTDEEFIENLFPVDIRYNVEIDCIVTQNGFRDMLLSNILKSKRYLATNKKLCFKIIKTDCIEPYDIYWKVRNVGPEAIKRNMIRGNIEKTNRKEKRETSNFNGPHYVECYLVKQNVCVAKVRINVPINSSL